MSFLSAVQKSTILITGGATGIGQALAKRFVALGHEVVIVSRNQTKLDSAKSLCPELVTMQGDISSNEGRQAIFEKVKADFPNLNVLINNAGENVTVPPFWKSNEQDWATHQKVIATHLEAPMHLSMLCLPGFLHQPNALILNVSAIVAFAPHATIPSYSAAKAGLHSFSLSLRHQLAQSTTRVVELIPPMVDTDFLPDKMRRFAAKLDPFADHVVAALLAGQEEITSPKMERITQGSRESHEAFFKTFNPPMEMK